MKSQILVLKFKKIHFMQHPELFFLCFLLEYCGKGCSRRNLANMDLYCKRQCIILKKKNKGKRTVYHSVDSKSKKRALWLYIKPQHTTANGTNIHAAYNTAHVATSVTVAALRTTNCWTLCHFYETVSVFAVSVVKYAGTFSAGQL